MIQIMPFALKSKGYIPLAFQVLAVLLAGFRLGHVFCIHSLTFTRERLASSLKSKGYICLCCFSCFIIFVYSWSSIAIAAPISLTLENAEQLGASTSSSTSSRFLRSSGVNHAGLTQSVLSEDTKLTFDREALLPATHFMNSDEQDDMTLVKIGVKKTFQSGILPSEQNRYRRLLATVQHNQQEDQRLQKLAQIRQSWLELYYWTQAKDWVETTLTQLPVGANPKILMAFQTLLKDTQQHYRQAQQQLGQWIGNNNALRPLPDTLPTWKTPPTLANMQAQLHRHPKIQADNAVIDAIKAEMIWSKSQSDPSIEIGASYGMRQQDMLNADPKMDTLSGELSIRLPNATRQSQAQESITELNRLSAAQAKQRKDWLMLLKALNNQYNQWQMNKRALAIQDHSVAQPTMSDALFLRLQQLRKQVSLAQSRAALLYF